MPSRSTRDSAKDKYISHSNKLVKAVSCLLVSSVMLVGALPAYGSTGIKPSVNQPKSIRQMSVDKKTGQPRFLLGDLSEPLETDEAVLAHITNQQPSIAAAESDEASSSSSELTLVKKNTDEQGQTHYLYQQVIQGIPVYGKYAYAHLDGQRKLYALTNGTDPALASMNITLTPGLPPEEAVQKYHKHLEEQTGGPVEIGGLLYGEELPAPTAELTVYADGKSPVLGYLIRFETVTPERASWIAVLDASNGDLLMEYNQIPHATDVNAKTGSGKGRNGETRSLAVYKQDNRFYMWDTTRSMRNYGVIATRNYMNPSYPISSSTTIFTDGDAVDAHYYTGLVYDYYRNVLGRDSYDNKGASIQSYVHWVDSDGSPIANALWDVEADVLVYGDGEAGSQACMACDLDIVAHEFTHGVTKYTSGLIYYGQPGALNEAFSDMMAAAMDKNWTVGEDTGSIIRSMAEPNKYDQPAHISQYVNTSFDSRGVHINSGIPNQAAYRMAEKLEAMGYNKWDMLGHLAYQALQLLTPTSDFYDARDAFAAAAQLSGYGEQVYNAVVEAWSEVGISGTEYRDVIVADVYEPNDSASEAGELAQVPFGRLDGTLHLDDVDYYPITLTASDYLYAELYGFSGNMFIGLLDSKFNEITVSDTAFSSQIFKTEKPLTEGTYYLGVDTWGISYDSKGAYSLFLGPRGNSALFRTQLEQRITEGRKLLTDHPYVDAAARADLDAALLKASGNATAAEHLFDITVELNGAIAAYSAYVDRFAPYWAGNSAITARDVTTSEAALSWTPAQDDKGVIGYRLYQDNALLAEQAGTEYKVSGLEAGKTYTFTVQAGDASGKWSTAGPSLTVTTTQAVPVNGGTGNGTGTGGVGSTTGGGIGGSAGAGAGAGGTVVPILEEEPAQSKETAQLEQALEGAANGIVSLLAAAGEQGQELKLPLHAGDLIGSNVLEVGTEDVKAVIQPKVLTQLGGLMDNGASEDAVIRWKLEKLGTAVPYASADGAGGLLKPASPLYEFQLAMLTKDGVERKPDSFQEPVEVTIRYGEAELNEQLLGVYYYNETTRAWEYAGGTVNAEQNRITAKLKHFSKYAVLEYSRYYTDVPSQHWGSQAIASLSAKHIVNGISADRFAPEGNTTRAEFAALLTRSLGLSPTVGSLPFEDVRAADWFYQAVSAAYQAGIINGKSAAQFAPNDRITREEMAVMIVRAAEITRGTTLRKDPVEFQDSAKMSDWAKPYIFAAANDRLMTGTGSGIFDPKELTTRAQSAQVIYNMLQRM